jgi:hypothetical protein
MNIVLTIEDAAAAQPHGNVVVMPGTTEDGRRVTFSGDAREMTICLQALVIDDEEQIVIEIEPWQLVPVLRQAD